MLKKKIVILFVIIMLVFSVKVNADETNDYLNVREKISDVVVDYSDAEEKISQGIAVKFDTEEEAIALANGTTYGLAGAVFSKDGQRAIRVANAIKCGQCYINNYFSKGMIESPGTGWKQSGIGVAGVHKYMITKTVFYETVEGTLPPM